MKGVEYKETEYKIPSSFGVYKVPRTAFIVHDVIFIERKLIQWYKNNHYSQGDDYRVSITNKGRWSVGHSNDCPLQHGRGKTVVLTDEQFEKAIKTKDNE